MPSGTERVRSHSYPRLPGLRKANIAFWLLALAASGCLGFAASRSHLQSTIFAIGLAGGFSFLLAARPGLGIGVLLLGVQNGLPLINTARLHFGGFAVDNYLAPLLIAVLAARALRRPRSRDPWGSRLTLGIGVGLSIWWAVVLVRSMAAGVPLGASAVFGRNYLVFAALVAVFPLGLWSARDRRDSLGVVAIGAVIYATGQVLTVTTGARLAWLIHPFSVITSDVGVQRLYSYMLGSVVFLFCLGVGAALFGSTSRQRWVGAAAVIIASAAIILQQTRALYLSLPVALLLATAVWSAFVPASRVRLSRRTVGGLVGLALTIALLTALLPEVVISYGARPLSRLGSTFTELSSSTGNLGYRFSVAGEMVRLLHGDLLNWALGLGFLDPRYRYFSELPGGALNNSDLGLLDGLVVIGVVGLVFLYLTVVTMCAAMLRSMREWRRGLPATAWLLFGISIWAAQVVLGSYTLGTLFQEPGQALVAFVLAVGLWTAAESVPPPRHPAPLGSSASSN